MSIQIPLKSTYEKIQELEEKLSNLTDNTDEKVASLSREKATAIVCDASGETITLTDSADTPIYSFSMYGKSTQDGEPTPDNPVPIESVENPTAIFSGKNLLPYPYRDTTKSTNGITFTDNGDGSITVNGTASAAAAFVLFGYSDTGISKSEGIFAISGGGNGIILSIDMHNTSNKWITSITDNGSGNYIDTSQYSGYSNMAMTISIPENVTINNVTVRPQFELGSTATTYEPYKSQSVTIADTTLRANKVSSSGNYADADGQMWLADKLTVYADGSGKIERNIKKATFDSAVGYYSAETSNGIRVVVGQITDAIDVNITTDDTYKALSPTFRLGATGETKTAVCFTVGSQNVFINDGVSTSVAEYTAYLTANPLEIYYPVATPTTETLTAEQVQEILALNTYRPTTVIINDAGATMEVEYSVDTKTYIDRKFNELATAIANL